MKAQANAHSPNPPPTTQYDFSTRVLASAVATGFAESICVPLEVCKVRLQVGGQYSGFYDVLSKTIRNEGVGGLFNGFAPNLVKHVSYCTLAFTIFDDVRDAFSSVLDGGGAKEASLTTRLLAGGFSGGLAITIVNPTETVKTLMQSGTNTGKGMAEVTMGVWRAQGVRGLWAGTFPNVVRCGIVDSFVIGYYDHAKALVVPYLGDNSFAYGVASAMAGIASACVATPVEVIKTRIMNDVGSTPRYRGMGHAFSTIIRDEGPKALFSGFGPILVRQPVWCILFFTVFEHGKATVHRRRYQGTS